MKKLLAISSVLVFTSFFFVQIVKAEGNVYSQTIDTNSVTPPSGQVHHHVFPAGSYTPGTVDTVQLKLSVPSGTSHVNIINFVAPGETNRTSDCQLVTTTPTLVNFTLSTPVNVIAGGFYFKMDTHSGTDCSGAFDQESVTVHGKTNAGTSILFGGFGVDQHLDPYDLMGNDVPVGQITITDPADGQIINSDAYTVSGTCPINGSNRLAIYGDDIAFGSQSFEFDCTAHAYSETFTFPHLGINAINVEDIANTSGLPNTYKKFVTVNNVSGNAGYGLTMIDPQCANNTCSNLEADNSWTFRIGYSLPNEDLRNQVTFEAYSCVGNFIDDCTVIGGIDTLDVVDADQNNYVDVTPIVVHSTVVHYYKIVLGNDSLVKAGLNFTTIAGFGDGTIKKHDPGETDLGVLGNTLRYLFVPNQKVLRQFVTTGDQLKTKIPFGYFYEVSDRLTNVSATDPGLNLVVPIHLAGQDFSWTLIDSSNNQISNVTNIMKPIITWVLWLGFIWYVYSRVRDKEL